MAIIKSIFNTFLLLTILVELVSCLYEDQIGKFDWKKSHIGKLKFANFDSVKRIVIATELNTLASINLKNGQIAWRQILETQDSHRIELLQVGTEVITVSGNGLTFYIRGWELNTGTLLFEWSLTVERDGGKWVISGDQLLHIVPVLNSHLEVTEYQIRTGANRGTTARVSTPWVVDLKKCVVAGTYWTCISGEESSSNLYSINLSGELTKVITKSLNTLMGDVAGKITIEEFEHSEPAIILRRNNINRIVIIGDLPKILPYSLESNVISITNGETNSILQKQNLGLKIFDLDNNEIKDFETEGIDKGVLVAGICRSSNCRVLLVTDDDAIHLLQLPSGKVQWSRDEALSDVVAAEFVELPLSELEISIEKEFNEASNDIFSMVTKRVLSQAKQIATFISGKPKSVNNGLVRDNFGLHKLIILATKVGKLFAIDTMTGKIVWSHFVPNTVPFTSLEKETALLYVQRTARYAPLSPEMTFVAKDKTNGFGVLYKFDPITGKSLSEVTILDYKIKQTLLLPYEDENHVHGILVLSHDDKLYVYPPSVNTIIDKIADKTFLFTADEEKSALTGYSIIVANKDNIKVKKTWNVHLPNSRIVSINMRPSIERVHSQGRVLADRSVFYKYVNPNLIAVATISDDIMHKHVLSIYLIDGVTGLVVYSTHHKRANAPVQLVHSENWIVYSYFSERFRRYEMTAIELYEGAQQSNSTAFSSYALSQLPHPETLSYILPVNPLAMTATLTERGITNKHVLIAISTGSVLEMPWAYLEPRDPHLLSNPEEGHIPYMPELPLITEAIINYNQSLARIRGIQVSPARLESTCLVIMYGQDLFYTRVTPSKTFDVLKEDFDHWLIVMVLGGLGLASYISKQLSIRKALKQTWK